MKLYIFNKTFAEQYDGAVNESVCNAMCLSLLLFIYVASDRR